MRYLVHYILVAMNCIWCVKVPMRLQAITSVPATEEVYIRIIYISKSSD